MRICSLMPGATEIVAALGLADHLVGISHECDYPSSVRHVPVMVESAVGYEGAGSADIDRQVKALASAGQQLYKLNERAFLDARPDVILAQDLCHVCAIAPDHLRQVLQSVPSRPRLMTLNSASLFDVVNDIERIAEALGEPSRGRELAQSLRGRIEAVRAKAATIGSRPRAVCLEWLSPPYVGGHWVPEMVMLAGGQDLLGSSGQPSRQVTWDEIHEAAPDVVVVMPCGFSVARTELELADLCRSDKGGSRAWRSGSKAYVVDAGSYFSRPGPRLVDGVELLAEIFSGSISPRFDRSAVREIAGSACPAGPSL